MCIPYYTSHCLVVPRKSADWLEVSEALHPSLLGFRAALRGVSLSYFMPSASGVSIC